MTLLGNVTNTELKDRHHENINKRFIILYLERRKQRKTIIKNKQRRSRKYIRRLGSLMRIKEHVNRAKANHSLKKKQSNVTKVNKHNGRKPAEKSLEIQR